MIDYRVLKQVLEYGLAPRPPSKRARKRGDRLKTNESGPMDNEPMDDEFEQSLLRYIEKGSALTNDQIAYLDTRLNDDPRLRKRYEDALARWLEKKKLEIRRKNRKKQKKD